MHEHEPTLKNRSYALKSPPQRREDVGLLNTMYNFFYFLFIRLLALFTAKSISIK